MVTFSEWRPSTYVYATCSTTTAADSCIHKCENTYFTVGLTIASRINATSTRRQCEQMANWTNHNWVQLKFLNRLLGQHCASFENEKKIEQQTIWFGEMTPSTAPNTFTLVNDASRHGAYTIFFITPLESWTAYQWIDTSESAYEYLIEWVRNGMV